MAAESDWTWTGGRHNDRWSWSDRQEHWSAPEWKQSIDDWSNYSPTTQSLRPNAVDEHETPWPGVLTPSASSSSPAPADEALTNLIAEFAHELRKEAARAYDVEAALRRGLPQPKTRSIELSKRMRVIESLRSDLARRVTRLREIDGWSQDGQADSTPSSSSRSISEVTMDDPWQASAVVQIEGVCEKQAAASFIAGRAAERGCLEESSSSAQSLYPHLRTAEWQSAVLCGNPSRSGHKFIAVDISSLIFSLDEDDVDESSHIDSRLHFNHEEKCRDFDQPPKQVDDIPEFPTPPQARSFWRARVGEDESNHQTDTLWSLDRDLKRVLLADSGVTI